MKPLIFIAMLLFTQQLPTSDPFTKIKVQKEIFKRLPLNEIKPAGWLEEQLRDDLNGFVGHLNELVPRLIVEDDIYGKDRLTKEEKNKDLGNNPEGEEWEIQYLWWNSETQSNWLDGYIRNAFLLRDESHIEKIKKQIDRILATQDEDGYLGIYAQDLRYHFDVENGENGELWAKASLFRGLLAYYEFTKDQKVLKAVERGVKNVMDNYKINASQPFGVKKSFAGVCHGLTFTDVLDRLYQLTNDATYWDYALFLYKDYSTHDLEEQDIQYLNIMDPEYRLKGHGVHAYEHLRTLLIAYYASGNPQLKEALQVYLRRIGEVTTVTGGAIGDEWIFSRKADPTYIGYEYCSLHELMDSYAQLVQKTGNIRYADQIENIFFNAAMGARHPEKSAIAYLKTDNSYEMTGDCNGIDDPHHRQTRYKYSPAHQDVAVCCVPNAGRITPYFIQNMWLKAEDGFVASLLGGCEVNTTFKNKTVLIKEITDYPYTNQFTFEVKVEKPVLFTLKIRKPVWNKGFTLNIDYEEKEDYIVIRKKWEGVNTFTLEFKADVEKHNTNDEVYFTYGGLVLALPIEATEIPGKIYAEGFQDFEYTPQRLILFKYANEMPMKEHDQFHINLYNPKWQRIEKKALLPLGHTLLRQVTFSVKQ
jgi:DUF1680 family protein